MVNFKEDLRKTSKATWMFLALIALVIFAVRCTGSNDSQQEKESFRRFTDNCAATVKELHGDVADVQEHFRDGYNTYYFNDTRCKIGESENAAGECAYQCEDY